MLLLFRPSQGSEVTIGATVAVVVVGAGSHDVQADDGQGSTDQLPLRGVT